MAGEITSETSWDTVCSVQKNLARPSDMACRDDTQTSQSDSKLEENPAFFTRVDTTKNITNAIEAYRSIPASVIAELASEGNAYIPPEEIPWGVEDRQVAFLDRVWVFRDFFIVRKKHTSFGLRDDDWFEYCCIPFIDHKATADFYRRATLH